MVRVRSCMRGAWASRSDEGSRPRKEGNTSFAIRMSTHSSVDSHISRYNMSAASDIASSSALDLILKRRTTSPPYLARRFEGSDLISWVVRDNGRCDGVQIFSTIACCKRLRGPVAVVDLSVGKASESGKTAAISRRFMKGGMTGRQTSFAAECRGLSRLPRCFGQQHRCQRRQLCSSRKDTMEVKMISMCRERLISKVGRVRWRRTVGQEQEPGTQKAGFGLTRLHLPSAN